MPLHRKLGAVYAVFSLIFLIANVYAPSNDDFLLNVIELSSLTVCFSASLFFNKREGGAIQVIALIVAAFIPIAFSDSPFFGAVVAVFAVVSTYAYGGYKTFIGTKFIGTCLGLFILCSLASSNFTAPGVEVFIRSAGWTVFIAVFLFTLWLIVDDINKTFYSQKEAELLKINKELIAMNKQLIGGCLDEPGKR